MLRRILLAGLLTSLAAAQQVITVGGTSTAPSRANIGKGNLFTIDQTSLMTNIELYLDVPGVETLTFFVYRSATRNGPADLRFTTSVTVNGTGAGATWYSSGQVLVPLVCGNTYLIGASWPGSVTYHYDRGTLGAPIPIGTWERGCSPANPPPATQSIAGTDVAQYYERLTVLPLQTAVACVGTGCSGTGGTPPRLVADGLARIGTQLSLDLVAALPSTPALFALAIGGAATTPTPLFGCSFWLDPRNPIFGVPALTSSAGLARLGLTVPNNPNLVGFPLSVQSAVVGAALDLTNALDLSVVN